MCTSSCMPRLRSRSSKPPPRPRRWSSARRRSVIRRWPCSIGTASTARRACTWPPGRPALKALVGAELTIRTQQQPYSPHPPSLWRLPVLVGSREGYRNLCRLITRMKAGAPKGEVTATGGALSLEDLDGATGGLVALAGRAVLGGARHGVGGLLDRLVGVFGRDRLYVELQRHLQRDEEADNHALVTLASAYHVPLLATNGVRFATPEDRPLHDVLTCIRHKTDVHRAGQRLAHNAERYLKSPAQMAQLFADRPEARGRHPRARRSARLHDGRSRLSLPRLSGAGGGDAGVVPAQGRRRRRARALPPVPRSRPGPDRARARSDREAGSGRLLPDRVGPRQLLPAARHPRPGPRLGRQQRGLLQPRHHRRRSGRHGAALRALPLGAARRVARHRSRPAERRSARAGDPVRLPALRRARRGDDRQRHHLSRPQRRARGRQGAGHRRRRHRSAGQGHEPLRVARPERDDRRATCATSASIPATRASATSSSCGRGSRTCRGTSASTRAAW